MCPPPLPPFLHPQLTTGQSHRMNSSTRGISVQPDPAYVYREEAKVRVQEADISITWMI